MILKKNFFVLVVAILLVLAGGSDTVEAQVLCKHKKKGKLSVRSSECKRNETQFDLTDLNAPKDQDVSRWSFLGDDEGTYWYVPTEYLPAIQWKSEDPQDFTTISDQTVWQIESYQDGYFFGPVVVQFSTFPTANCQFLIGSITPDGRVYIAFNSLQPPPIGNPTLTIGIGQMVKKKGDWTFNMQMASGIAEIQLEHSAFMEQCTPDDDCWLDLPGVDQSVLDFLSQCGVD